MIKPDLFLVSAKFDLLSDQTLRQHLALTAALLWPWPDDNMLSTILVLGLWLELGLGLWLALTKKLMDRDS